MRGEEAPVTSTTRRTSSTASIVLAAARAALAVVLAAVTTFWPQPDRTAAFALVVLGAFLLVQGAVLAAGSRAGFTRRGVLLLLARAAVSVVAGALAVSGVQGGIALLIPLQSITFLLIGALELLGGTRGSGAPDTAGDAVVVGGLQMLVGVLLVVLLPDALFAVGVLSAWSAVTAVYLGIAAANQRRGRVPA